MTVAKLEMQAAVFGARLRGLILGDNDTEVDRIVHWTDSTTVLQWLHASNNNATGLCSEQSRRDPRKFTYRSMAAC